MMCRIYRRARGALLSPATAAVLLATPEDALLSMDAALTDCGSFAGPECSRPASIAGDATAAGPAATQEHRRRVTRGCATIMSQDSTSLHRQVSPHSEPRRTRVSTGRPGVARHAMWEAGSTGRFKTANYLNRATEGIENTDPAAHLLM